MVGRPKRRATSLAALFKGLLVGFSIQAVDQVPARALDGAITGALTAWDSAVVSTVRPVKRACDLLP